MTGRYCGLQLHPHRGRPPLFANLRVLAGGKVTHSYVPNGVLQTNAIPVTGEPHVLSRAYAAALDFQNVAAASVVVRDALGLVTYSDIVDYYVVFTNGQMSIMLPEGSSIVDGSTNLVDYTITGASGLNLAVAGDVFVGAGGAIAANANGYGHRMGPGAGNPAGSNGSGSGAGHGGYGGRSSGIALPGAFYDSILLPADKGSGSSDRYGTTGAAGGARSSSSLGALCRSKAPFRPTARAGWSIVRAAAPVGAFGSSSGISRAQV